MTREEAKRNISNALRWGDKADPEALRMAIKALEQEPCDDAISRQAVKEQMIRYGFHAPDMTVTEFVEDLPSVNPKPKTGHWEMPVQDDGMSDPIYYQVRCSECGFDLDPQTWDMELRRCGADKYCPSCGARMESEE